MKVKISELETLVKKILSSTYYSKDQASDIAEVLIYAEKVGKNTQGIIKLLGKEPIQNIKPQAAAKVVKETKLSSLINGGGNPGILVSRMATKIVINKCRENGLGIVGTNNTFSSTGVIGFYASEIANSDFIGIVAAGSPSSVAPYGSIEALFGTNPMAFGFPTDNEPLIFDMATAAITWFGLVRAKTLGQKIPEGMAIDNEGNITTDPEQAMSGAILPFDKNYKGSGLSMMVEMLTGPLVGAAFANLQDEKGWGNLFMAIDPEILIGRKEFKKNSSLLIQKIKSSKPQKGFNKVSVPGERGLEFKKKVEKTGEIEIEDSLYQQLQSLA